MAFHETYQVYNPQNKQFVKMRNGEILECSYFKYEGVPLFGGAPDPPPEPKNGDSENTRQSQNGTANDNKSAADNDSEEDNSGIFEWF